MKKLSRRQLRKLILTEAYWLNEDAHEEDLDRKIDAFVDRFPFGPEAKRLGLANIIKEKLRAMVKSQPDLLQKLLASDNIVDLIDKLL
jgi:hypothetical protein